MTQAQAFLVFFYLAGVALRITWPYALAWIQHRAPFDYRYAIGQVLIALIALLPTFAASDFLVQLGALGYLGAMLAGYGAAAVGRSTQRTVDTIQARS
jgi:hypothetical protein